MYILVSWFFIYYIEKNNACIKIKEKELNNGILEKNIEELLDNKMKLNQLIKYAKISSVPNATNNIINTNQSLSDTENNKYEWMLTSDIDTFKQTKTHHNILYNINIIACQWNQNWEIFMNNLCHLDISVKQELAHV